MFFRIFDFHRSVVDVLYMDGRSILISSVEATLMLAVVALAVDFYVNYKFVIHYYVFMLASLAPAVLCAVLFELNPAYSVADGAFA